MSAQAARQGRLVQAGFAVIALAVWTLITATGAIGPLFLPPPQAVAGALGALLSTGQFWPPLAATIGEVAEAYGIAVALGLFAGFLIARSSYWLRVFEPIVSGLFAIPITLFLPLFVLTFGIGTGSKIAYGATYAFFPVALNTIAGISGVDGRYVRAEIGRAHV